MDKSRSLRVQSSIPLWRDERFLRILGQVVFLAILAAILGYLTRNMLANMRQQGMGLGFDFLRLTAGFDIGEHIIPYDRSYTFLRAYLVGLLNTALVSGLGIVLATILGVVFGVARLSSNFLVQLLARAYVEFLRNIPLLVLLIFLYTAVFIKAPRVKEALILPDPILLTNREWRSVGIQPTLLIVYACFDPGCSGHHSGCIAGMVRTADRSAPLTLLWSTPDLVAVAILGWVDAYGFTLTWTPVVQGLRLAGGQQLSPEFMALLFGLSIYTSAFIADVVRAGIQSVSHGQVEASKSLGLTTLQTLRMVVFPQALRVIIPPLTSQYLNLIKNSSLAVLIGYPELFHVSGTILNQSGRAVEMIALVMATYLTISLLTSALMNWYNRRVRLVER
jgi:general L-amino acid transport system permease protein